jgi:hypothetical protein
VSQADCAGQPGSQQQVALGHQLLLQSQFPFGQHVDANGQINFAGADMAGTSYLPGEAVFLPATMGAADGAAAFSQPDLPGPGGGPAVASVQDPCALSKKGPVKSKTSGKKKVSLNQPQQPIQPLDIPAPALSASEEVEAVTAGMAAAVNLANDVSFTMPFVDRSAAEAVAAVASAAVDLDSETDSNHDTALTLACAGGHEELVTLLISRGANIGKISYG